MCLLIGASRAELEANCSSKRSDSASEVDMNSSSEINSGKDDSLKFRLILLTSNQNDLLQLEQSRSLFRIRRLKLYRSLIWLGNELFGNFRAFIFLTSCIISFLGQSTFFGIVLYIGFRWNFNSRNNFRADIQGVHLVRLSSLILVWTKI